MTHHDVHDSHDPHDEFGGLHRDTALMSRRRALVMFGLGAAGIAACGSDDSAGSTTAPAGTGAVTDSLATDPAVTCEATPSETEGPFPADGNGGRGNVDALGDGSVVRADIRTSNSGVVAAGMLLRIRFDVFDKASGCAPMAGAAVYAWHCDIDGRYSLYDGALTDVDYLRGVQAGDTGTVEFQSAFPGCYDGRWPHIHFEVFSSIDEATNGANAILTSQIAFRQDVCEQVYATDGYSTSLDNLSRVSLAGDNVFADGVELQLGSVSGTMGDDDFTVALNVVV